MQYLSSTVSIKTFLVFFSVFSDIPDATGVEVRLPVSEHVDACHRLATHHPQRRAAHRQEER